MNPRIPILAQLAGAIAVFAITALVLAALSLRHLRAIDEHFVAAVRGPAEVMRHAAETRQHVLVALRAERDFILEEVTEARAADIASIDRAAQVVDENLDRLEAIAAPDDRRDLERVREAWTAWLAVDREVRALARARRVDEAFDLSRERGRPLIEEAERRLGAILDRHEEGIVAAGVLERRQFESFVRTTVVVTVAGLVFALTLSFLVARGVSRRLRRLAAQARYIERTRDLGRPIEPRGNDEIADLAASFDEMRRSLLRSRDALREANEQLERRVEERTAELRRRNEELDQFAYVASHDLKAPLRAIDNLSTWIEEDLANALPPASRDHLTKLRGRVSRMERLLDDLLQYSRIDRIAADAEEVDTRELVRDVADMLNVQGRFRIEVEGDFPVLHTARAPLELVFRNLVSNAIKHSGRDGEGRIEIRARDDGEFVEFEVRDDGPGIDPRFHDRVFQMFQTLRPRDEVEGSGMGLALVKKTVESRGGTIEVESSEGRGAAFRFRWPRTGAAHPW